MHDSEQIKDTLGDDGLDQLQGQAGPRAKALTATELSGYDGRSLAGRGICDARNGQFLEENNSFHSFIFFFSFFK